MPIRSMVIRLTCNKLLVKCFPSVFLLGCLSGGSLWFPTPPAVAQTASQVPSGNDVVLPAFPAIERQGSGGGQKPDIRATNLQVVPTIDTAIITPILTKSPLPPLGEPSAYLPSRADALGIHLIVKLHDRKVYVYKGDKAITSYPIAVGKPGWETPLGNYQVFSKEVNPIFKSFKTGAIIGPGPDNPLGIRWIGIWTDGKTQLGFHGTNQPELIGEAVSHGCMRMRNKDVLTLFEQVSVGTPVTVEP